MFVSTEIDAAVMIGCPGCGHQSLPTVYLILVLGVAKSRFFDDSFDYCV